jgi:Ca-activated chloride channel family protein
VKADFVLDYDVIAMAREQHVYVLARIQGEPAPHSEDRLPLNLSLVLDRSGSMAGDKLEYVKQAAQYLAQRLGASDRLSLVSYNHNVNVDIPPEPVVHKDRFLHRIAALTASGNTNLSGGWLQGCQLVAESMATRQINRVLLLTDGLANEGVTDPARLEAMARQKRAEGITTTTMGVGMDFNENLLTRMAAEGGGAFYFIDHPDQAPHIFAEELKDLLNVIGQNLVITLTPSREVRLVRQWNAYPAEVQGASVHFRLGDLFADELKILLLELSIPALAQLGEAEVALLRFEYDELGAETVTHRTLELPIKVNIVSEADFAGHAPNEEVVRTALLLRAARAREEAIEHADQGDFEGASEVLSATANLIRDSHIRDAELQKQHDMLREEASDMGLGSRRYDAYSRKSHATKSVYTERFSARMGDTVALHTRMKQSREAMERGGEPPTMIFWQDESFDLSGVTRVQIGRDQGADIVIPEDEVSFHHAEIKRVGEDLILLDLDSRNGTFANGGKLTPQTPFRLSVGDVVTIGTRLLMFGKPPQDQ